MEVGIGPQAVVERRYRREFLLTKRDPRMGIDHSAPTFTAECTAEFDKRSLPVESFVETAGRDPTIHINGHGPRACGCAVAVPERSAEPAPLPQRRAAEHRRTGTEAVHYKAGLDYVARSVQHETAGETDLWMARRPVGEFGEAARRDRLHAARQEHERPGVGDRLRHDLVDHSGQRVDSFRDNIDTRERRDPTGRGRVRDHRYAAAALICGDRRRGSGEIG